MDFENNKTELISKSKLLSGKRIVLGVTGSIAAVEDVKLIHELRRHGAIVFPVMTQSAMKIIHPYSLQYASENEVVTEITGRIEHVTLVNNSDLILIAPATANTISKAANGIDDTTVTSVLSNAIGRKPIIIVPAMHQGMMDNPILKENMQNLIKNGVVFLDPIIEENKAKMADIEYITASVIRVLNPLCIGKKVAVVGGSSAEPIDDVRVITNLSSGETTVSFVKAFYYFGAELHNYLGLMRTEVPSYLKYESFKTVDDLISLIPKIRENDLVIVPAALSDFTLKKQSGKISSEEELNLKLFPAKKFLKELRRNYDGILIGFKAEYGVSEKDLINRAKKRLEEYNLDYIIANRLEDVKHANTIVYLIGENNVEKFKGDKDDVSISIVKKLCESLFPR